MADPEPLFRDPSKLFFQADSVRRSILSAYWLIILLSIPLWWSTTSIERLSLPSFQVISQTRNHLSIPVRLRLEIGSDGELVATQLQNLIDERIKRTPEHWEGLEIHVDHALSGGTSVAMLKYACS